MTKEEQRLSNEFTELMAIALPKLRARYIAGGKNYPDTSLLDIPLSELKINKAEEILDAFIYGAAELRQEELNNGGNSDA